MVSKGVVVVVVVVLKLLFTNEKLGIFEIDSNTKNVQFLYLRAFFSRKPNPTN